MSRLPTLLLPLAFAAAAACADDEAVKGDNLALTASAVTEASVANVRTLARQLWNAQQWLRGSDGASALDDLLGNGTTDEPLPGAANQLFLPDDELDFEAWLDDVEAALRDHIFARAAIEDESPTAIVYRLTGDTMCDADEAADAEDACREVLADLEVRVRVVSFATGDLDATVLLGPEREAALRVELHKDVFSVELLLGNAVSALRAFAAATSDDDGPSIAAPTAQGALRLVVRRLAEQRVRLAYEVTEALIIDSRVDGDALHIASGEGSFAIDVDATARTASVDVDLGAATLVMPKRVVGVFDEECQGADALGNEQTVDCDTGLPIEDEEEPLAGTVGLTIGRLAGLLDFDDPTVTVAAKGFLHGPSNLQVDGVTVLEFTVGDGATPLDVAATFRDLAAANELHIAPSRALDAALLTRLDLAPEVFEGVDPWLGDDDLIASFAGMTPVVTVADTGVIVTRGTLTLTSHHAAVSPLVIAEGQCAAYVEAPDDTVEDAPFHPFDFTVGPTCPAAEADDGL